MDDIIWVKIDKSLLSLSSDLYIALCYVTPDDSSRQSMLETNVSDRLLDSVSFIENKTRNCCNLLVCGDFNSRTSICPDYVVNDEFDHMSVLPDEYISDTQLPRFSQDEGHVNNNGLLLLDFCKQTGLRIMNGRVGNDSEIGRYTFVGHRGCSVVDYGICSQNLFNFIKEFEVQEPNILSDHCMINFSFDFIKQQVSDAPSEDFEYVNSKFVWNNELKEEYLEKLQQSLTTEKLFELNSNISCCTDSNNIQSCLSDFVNILDNVSAPLFKKKIYNVDQNETENDYFTEKKPNSMV